MRGRSGTRVVVGRRGADHVDLVSRLDRPRLRGGGIGCGQNHGMRRSLDARDIRRLRLVNQWLAPRPEASAREVAEHLGALQAQEIGSGRWSLGARSAVLDGAAVDEAIAAGDVVRTWPLRNTVHVVSSVDAHWMLRLAETFAYKGVERRRAFLGLDEADADRAVEVLRTALAHGEPVTRDDCVALLADAGVLGDKSFGYHLLWFAAQHGATCFGPQIGSKSTFVHLDSWVAEPRELTRDESLAELARRYFTSHGPVAATEMRRWTGLGAADVKRAIEMAGDELCEVATTFGPMLMGAAAAETIGSAPIDPPDPERSVLLLSGFDEYVLGYGDRGAFMEDGHLQRVIPGNNGVFRPTIVADGQVIGTWKPKTTKTRVDITLEPFTRLTKAQRAGVERAAEEYGAFLGLTPKIIDP